MRKGAGRRARRDFRPRRRCRKLLQALNYMRKDAVREPQKLASPRARAQMQRSRAFFDGVRGFTTHFATTRLFARRARARALAPGAKARATARHAAAAAA